MRARSSLPQAALQTPALKNFSRMLLKVTQASHVSCATVLAGAHSNNNTMSKFVCEAGARAHLGRGHQDLPP